MQWYGIDARKERRSNIYNGKWTLTSNARLPLKTTANLKAHESKVPDQGIKLPFPHPTMAKKYLVANSLMEGQYLAKPHSKFILVHKNRQFYEHTFFLSLRFFTVETEKFAWCPVVGIFLPLVPRSVGKNAPLHCPEDEQPPEYKQKQHLHHSRHRRAHVGSFSTHNQCSIEYKYISSPESV